MSTITVVIPIHDPLESFESFIRAALESLAVQTLKPNEILMAGTNKPSYLNSLLNEHANFFEVHYFINDAQSTSRNLNYLIQKCNFEIVKILFQDYFFMDNSALEKIDNLFNNKKLVCIVSGSKNYDEIRMVFIRNIKPKFGRRMREGVNTIGCPSVISFRRSFFMQFKENLVMRLDSEWYLSKRQACGRAFLLSDFQIASRLHAGQQTHWAKKLVPIERQIVGDLHPPRALKQKIFFEKCKCEITEPTSK